MLIPISLIPHASQTPEPTPGTYEGLGATQHRERQIRYVVAWPCRGWKDGYKEDYRQVVRGILLGEFFFSRSDGTGAQLASLAPTLAYRMVVHTFKDARQAISDVVGYDPSLPVIILDGLDETPSPDDQQLVLDVISETLYPFNQTLRILICSRPEPTIVTAFHDPDSLLNDISTNISLNDDADSDADIRAFLVEKFSRIKKRLPHPPSGEWPTPANIDYFVAKSSRQFIFAATVDKYVCSPKHRHHAVSRLEHVLNLRLLPHLEDKRKHPFADLILRSEITQ